MGAVKEKIIIFEYRDYRTFLRDWFAQAKKSHRAFSLRAFSLRAGFKSPNFFKLVADGDRNLTEGSLPPFMKGLGLNKQEQEFFRNLVFFNQASTHEKRDYYYRKLLQSRRFSELKSLERDQYDFYSAWYHPVLRELLISIHCDGTPEWLAKHVHPAITKEQAERSIVLLEKLGLVKKIGPNQWKQSNPLVSTGPEVHSIILMNYHQNLLQLSRDILPIIPGSQRDISALTLGLSSHRLPELKKKIQDFRKEILKFVALDEHPDTVIQLDMQMFPVSISGEETLP